MLRDLHKNRYYREGSMSLISGLLSMTGQYYKAPEIRALRRFLQELQIDCVFDVGANSGQYAKMLRRWVGYKGLIISFEPHPDLIEPLSTASKNDPLWHIEPIALSTVTGTIPIYLTADTQFSSAEKPLSDVDPAFSKNVRIEKTFNAQSETLDVAYERLRQRFKFSRPFLKMDTQGHDLAIFRSGSSVTRNFIGLQSELTFQPFYQDIPLFIESLETYKHDGFLPNSIFLNTRGHFPLLREMDCILVNTRAVSADASRPHSG